MNLSPETNNIMALDDFLSVDGEMGARIRAFDWSQTPLGPVTSWSPSLKMMVRFLLMNRFPLLLWWGPEFIQIYNDPYRPVLGAKHPSPGLGRPVSECWSEIWHILRPLIETPFRGGPATWMEDIQLEINRHGFMEETHFTIAYSPVPDDTVPGGIGGVLATVHEITDKVIGERRLAILRDLGSRPIEAKTAEEACAVAANTFAKHPKDIPFAALYLVDADGKRGRLAGATEFAQGAQPRLSVISLDEHDHPSTAWPLAAAMRTETLQVVEHLADYFGDTLPPGPWSDAPHQAVIVPIRSNVQHRLAGFLVAGVSARLRLDEAYRSFLELAASQLAIAIANARAYEEERQRAEALAEIDRAKTDFFSNVSHEFRTPLMLMLGSLEDVLAENSLPPAAHERLSAAHRNSQRLLKLVNPLLDFSRIAAGRVEAVYEPIDLAAYTAELASVFRSATEKAGLEFIVNCAPLPEAVYGDSEMWEKIVLNLMADTLPQLIWVTDAAGRLEFLNRQWIEYSGITLDASVTAEQIAAATIHPDDLPLSSAAFAKAMREERGFVVEQRHRAATGEYRWFLNRGEPYRDGQTGQITKWIGSGTDIHDRKMAEGARRASEAQLADEAQSLARLHDASSRLWRLPELQAGLEEMLAATITLLGADMGNIQLLDTERDVLHIVAQQGFTPEFLEFFREVSAAHESACGRTLRAGQRTIIEDVELDAPYAPLRALARRVGYRAVQATPLVGRDGKPIGMLSTHWRAPHHPSEQDLRRLDLYVRQAADFIERDRNEAALRESRERFDIVRDGAQVGFWFCDLPFDKLIWDNRVKEHFWLSPEAEVTIHTFYDQLHPDDRERTRQAIDESIANQTRYEIEYRTLSPTGQEKWIRALGRTFYDAQGSPIRFDGVTLDITERKCAEEALRAAMEREQALRVKAEEANRLKDEFLAVVSHELKTPLNAINGWAGMLHGGMLNDEQTRKAIETIARNAKIQKQLIDDLLDVSRIVTGKMRLNINRVALAEVIDAAIETVRHAAEAKGIRLQIEDGRLQIAEGDESSVIHHPQSAIVMADFDRLQQVIWNLVSNAIKFTPTGGSVNVTAQQIGEQVEIIVSDNGKGIQPEFLPYVFDRFRQEDASIKRKDGGLGLGLAIVRQLVELHGGTVRVESAGLGQGATFTVKLPLRAPQPSLVVNIEPAAMDKNLVGILNGKSVLVVDDEPEARALIRAMLERGGAEVRCANSVAEGFAVIENWKPDAIVSDIGMPDVDGYEFMQALRRRSVERGGSIPAVALTAYTRTEDRVRALAAGFQMQVAKPVEPNEILLVIATLVNRKGIQ